MEWINRTGPEMAYFFTVSRCGNNFLNYTVEPPTPNAQFGTRGRGRKPRAILYVSSDVLEGSLDDACMMFFLKML